MGFPSSSVTIISPSSTVPSSISNGITLDISEENIVDVWFSDQYSNDKKIFFTTSSSIKSFNTETKHLETLYTNNSILKITHDSSYISVLTQDKTYISIDDGVNWETILSDEAISDIEFDENQNLYLKLQDGIYVNKIDSESKLQIPTLNEEILGYRIKNNFMYIYTSHSLLSIDLQNNKINEYKLEQQIDNIFLSGLNPNELFVVSDSKLAKVKITKGGEQFEIHDLNSFNGTVSAVNSSSDVLLISVIPNFIWKKGDINE